MKSNVSYYLDDLSKGYFTDVQLTSWINFAQAEVQRIMLQAAQDSFVIRYETTTVINQTDYVLPQGFHKMNRVELVISGTPPNEIKGPLLKISTNQMDLVTYQPGVPSVYYLKSNRMVILPAPVSTYTLRIYYSPYLFDMVLDTDECQIPDPYSQLVVILAAFNGYIKDGRDAPATLVQAKDEMINFIKQDAQERTQDSPRSIVTTDFSSTDQSWWY